MNETRGAVGLQAAEEPDAHEPHADREQQHAGARWPAARPRPCGMAPRPRAAPPPAARAWRGSPAPGRRRASPACRRRARRSIVRVSMTVPSLGQVGAEGLEQRPQPRGASTSPSRSRRSTPSRPSSRPLERTARITWPREAPSVRSSANSRMRCATVIENVLKMMNAPTNSAMPAKTSSAVVRNPSAWRMSSTFWSACCWPVRTLTATGPAPAQLVAQLRAPRRRAWPRPGSRRRRRACRRSAGPAAAT